MKIIIAKAMLFNNGGNLLLVRRSKSAPRRPLQWDFPGGSVDDNDESYQAACLREIAEETSLSVADDKLRLVYTESAIQTLGGEAADVSWLYFSGVSKADNVQLSYEHDDYCWVSTGKALQLIEHDTQLRALKHLQQSVSN